MPILLHVELYSTAANTLSVNISYPEVLAYTAIMFLLNPVMNAAVCDSRNSGQANRSWFGWYCLAHTNNYLYCTRNKLGTVVILFSNGQSATSVRRNRRSHENMLPGSKNPCLPTGRNSQFYPLRTIAMGLNYFFPCVRYNHLLCAA